MDNTPAHNLYPFSSIQSTVLSWEMDATGHNAVGPLKVKVSFDTSSFPDVVFTSKKHRLKGLVRGCSRFSPVEQNNKLFQLFSDQTQFAAVIIKLWSGCKGMNEWMNLLRTLKNTVNIINTWCILRSEIVNMTIMTVTVSEESLARDRHTHTHTQAWVSSKLKCSKLLTTLKTKKWWS